MAKSKAPATAPDADPDTQAASAQPAASAAKFVAQWHVKRDGRLVEPGEVLDLTESEAAQLGAAVAPVAAE